MSMWTALVWSAILFWLMIVLAGLLKYRAWTLAGLGVMMSNRGDVPPFSPLASRADRAAKNMMENFVLFIAVAAAVYFSGAESDASRFGAALFFWARVAYWPVYLAGIVYLRTTLWAIGVVGIAIMAFDLIL
jgi:uncharacterized MAPEG superfamily protein